MKLTTVIRGGKKLYNCQTHALNAVQSPVTKIFSNLDDMLNYARDITNDRYIITCSIEIYHYIRRTKHDILLYKNWQFA